MATVTKNRTVLSEEKIFEKFMMYDGRQVMAIAHMTLWVR
jgi:hypothetical protein